MAFGHARSSRHVLSRMTREQEERDVKLHPRQHRAEKGTMETKTILIKKQKSHPLPANQVESPPAQICMFPPTQGVQRPRHKGQRSLRLSQQLCLLGETKKKPRTNNKLTATAPRPHKGSGPCLAQCPGDFSPTIMAS